MIAPPCAAARRSAAPRVTPTASPRLVTVTGRPAVVEQLGGRRRLEDARGRGTGHRAGPRRDLGQTDRPGGEIDRIEPGTGSRGSPQGTQRTRSAGVRPPWGTGRHHVVEAEHPLHAGEDARRAIDSGRVATPEAELAPARRDHLVREEPQQGEPAGEVPPAAARAPSPPVIQPSSCHRTRSVSAAGVSAPSWRHDPGQVLAVLGLGLDHDLRAREPALLQPGQQPVGQRPWPRTSPRRPARPAGRARRPPPGPAAARSARAGAPPPRARAGARRMPSGPKRASTAGRGSSANAPRVRSPSRHRTPARPSSPRTADRPGREEGRRLPRRDDEAAARREPRREGTVGDPDRARPRRRPGTNASRTRGDEPVVPAEVARRAAGGEPEHPGPVDHEPRREPLDRARHRLERARVGARSRPRRS